MHVHEFAMLDWLPELSSWGVKALIWIVWLDYWQLFQASLRDVGHRVILNTHIIGELGQVVVVLRDARATFAARSSILNIKFAGVLVERASLKTTVTFDIYSLHGAPTRWRYDLVIDTPIAFFCHCLETFKPRLQGRCLFKPVSLWVLGVVE